MVVHVVRRLARREEDGLELDFSLGLEVDPRRRVRRISGESLPCARVFLNFLTFDVPSLQMTI